MKVSSLDLVFERILPFFTLVRLRYFRGFSGEGLDNFYHYEISSRFSEVHRARKTLSPKSHQRWYSPNYINTSWRQKVGIINKMMTKKKKCLFESECLNKHWKTHSKGNDIITNVISAIQHVTSTFSMQIFKFQRHSCKLSFLFPPRCQKGPESLLADYAWRQVWKICMWILGLKESTTVKIKGMSLDFPTHLV